MLTLSHRPFAAHGRAPSLEGAKTRYGAALAERPDQPALTLIGRGKFLAKGAVTLATGFSKIGVASRVMLFIGWNAGHRAVEICGGARANIKLRAAVVLTM